MVRRRIPANKDEITKPGTSLKNTPYVRKTCVCLCLLGIKDTEFVFRFFVSQLCVSSCVLIPRVMKTFTGQELVLLVPATASEKPGAYGKQIEYLALVFPM